MKYPQKLFRAAASAICVCCILWSSASGRQRGTVSGVVLDQETGKPVPMVNVWVEGTSRWCTTDTAGSFLLRVPLRAKAVLVFNHVAYRDTSRALYLEHGAELDELDPKGVKRVIIWDTKWSWAPFPSRLDTRFVVSVETK